MLKFSDQLGISVKWMLALLLASLSITSGFALENVLNDKATYSLTASRLRPDTGYPILYSPGKPIRFSFAPEIKYDKASDVHTHSIRNRRRGIEVEGFRIWFKTLSGRYLSEYAIEIVSGRPGAEVKLELDPGRYIWGLQWKATGGEVSNEVETEFVLGDTSSSWENIPWRGAANANEFLASVNFRKYMNEYESTEIVNVELMIATLGFGFVQVNGYEISKDILSYSGWTNTEKRVLYRSYDITKFLNESMGGEIFVGLGCGYRCDPFHRFPAYKDTVNKLSHDSVPKIFRMRIEINNQLVFHSGSEGWLMRQGPTMEDSVYDGETYNPEAATSWVRATHLDSGITGPTGLMIPAHLPGVQVLREDKPVQISRITREIHVVDFGSNVAGVCSISFKGPAKVTLKHGEIMQHEKLSWLPLPDPNRVYFQNLRSALAKDTIILAENESVSRWRPRFTYHGFRYVEIHGYPGNLSGDSISRLVFNTAVEEKSSAKFSEEVIQMIYEGAKGSQRSNLMQVPTDCPQRDERLGWLGDASLSAASMLTNFHYGPMLSAFLDSIVDELDHQGRLPDTVPFQRFGIRPADLSWSAAFLENLWQLWTVDGNLKPTIFHWDKVKLHMSYLFQVKQKAGNFKNLPQLYGDWCPPPLSPGTKKKETPSKGFTSAFSLIRSFEQAADLGHAVGKHALADADSYTLLAKKLKEDFHVEYYNPMTKQYDNGAMVTFVLPLALEAVPKMEKESVMRGLLNHIQKQGNTWTGGIMNNRYVFDVLHKNGAKDIALNMLQQKEYPSYGYMYFNEYEPARECMWEVPDAPFQGPGSLDVDTATAIVGTLSQVRATTNTDRGTIRFSWSYNENRLYINVTVPIGMQMYLHIPQDIGWIIPVPVSDEFAWKGITYITSSIELYGDVYSQYLLSSGEYEFCSRKFVHIDTNVASSVS